jgi:hypothetical protein
MAAGARHATKQESVVRLRRMGEGRGAVQSRSGRERHNAEGGGAAIASNMRHGNGSADRTPSTSMKNYFTVYDQTGE